MSGLLANHKKWWAAVALAIAAAIVIWLGECPQQHIRLLDGNSTIEISQFAFIGQQRGVKCRNADACRYLSRAMRASSRSASYLGRSYDLKLVYLNGMTSLIDCDVVPNGLEFSIPTDPGYDFSEPTRSVFFSDPPPPVIVTIWRFLNANHQDVSGQILNVSENGQVHFTHANGLRDPSGW